MPLLCGSLRECQQVFDSHRSCDCTVDVMGSASLHLLSAAPSMACLFAKGFDLEDKLKKTELKIRLPQVRVTVSIVKATRDFVCSHAE